MKILTVHNSYQQPGGEDEVFRQEANLLAGHGHEVVRYQASNEDLHGQSPVQLAANTVFSMSVCARSSASIGPC